MTHHPTESPIRAYRLSRRLTLKQFGELFPEPYDKTTIFRWERDGAPRDVRTILEIEKVTGIPRTALAPEMFDFSTMSAVS
ncbi:helix-turn-helix domain-containing protein [Shinella pollutisoli]|uniref:Helix-turn-helix domain-containing protein n=1 Tax=Shinella pollutisoli TaxID=2250594 RepID=A0ABV7DJ14_9HYPH|nr:helix-turn-helix transcriptional regulator [Shinella pollutisoli]